MDYKKITQTQMASILGVDVKTIRNWKTNRPNLYQKVIEGFMFEDAIKQAKFHYEAMNNLSKKAV